MDFIHNGYIIIASDVQDHLEDYIPQQENMLHDKAYHIIISMG